MKRLLWLFALVCAPLAFADIPIPKDSDRFLDFRGTSNFTDVECEKLYDCETYEQLRDQLVKAIDSIAPKDGHEWEDSAQANAVATCRLALIRTHYLLGELDEADALLSRLHPVNEGGILGDLTDREERLRVVSYNVWYGFTKVPERKANYLEWMKAQNPDVVSLQELNGYTADQLKADAVAWGHEHSAILKENGFPTGITSRFPIEEVKRFREGFHHGLLRARIRGIYYYVIHLHPSNWETRGREAGLILADIKTLPEGAEVMLVGDFNTFSAADQEYYAHGKLEPFFGARDEKYEEKNLREGKLDYSVIAKFTGSGLVDLDHAKRGDGYRFTGSFPTKIEKPGDHGSARRLDYVFASPSLAKRVTRAEVIADETTWKLSDHLPVIVDLEAGR